MASAPLRVLVTGAGGLLGYHCRAALFARNYHQVFHGGAPAFDIVTASREEFSDPDALATCLSGCAAVLHLAGLNRASPEEVELGNPRIARALVEAMGIAGVNPHVVYANSTHAQGDTPYGRGKAEADRVFADWARASGARYSNVIIPHVFGEGGVPFYNTVTATLCRQIVDGKAPDINPGASVELLHAGAVADAMLEMIELEREGTVTLEGRAFGVEDLHETIRDYKTCYDANRFPDLSDPFHVSLFNTYRAFEFPQSFPRLLTLHNDPRGVLFEAVKGGGGGQTFLSWTEPGVERGNHFHRGKVERFLVISGNAQIRVRRLFDDTVHRFDVSGERLEAIDMPVLHVHSIVNTGDRPLLTLFWAHEIFDPDNADTYAHPVLP